MKTFDCMEGQGIVIDGRIRVKVAEIAGDEVCLEIDLPEDMVAYLAEDLDALADR